MWILFDFALLAAGYIASIYTWPKIRVWVIGTASEVERLRQRALQIEARLRSR